IPKRLTELYWRLTGGARPETAAEAEEDQRDLVAENGRTSNLKPVMGAKRRSRKKKAETSESSSGDDDTATKAYDNATSTRTTSTTKKPTPRSSRPNRSSSPVSAGRPRPSGRWQR